MLSTYFATTSKANWTDKLKNQVRHHIDKFYDIHLRKSIQKDYY